MLWDALYLHILVSAYGLWGGLWSTGTVMYAYTGRHISVSTFIVLKKYLYNISQKIH